MVNSLTIGVAFATVHTAGVESRGRAVGYWAVQSHSHEVRVERAGMKGAGGQTLK